MLVHVTDGHVQRAARLAAEIVALADVGRLRLSIRQAELARVEPGEQLGQLVHQFELGCQAERCRDVALMGVVKVNGHEARQVGGLLMRLAEFFRDHGGGHDEQISAAGISGRGFFVFLLGRGFALAVSFLHKILQTFGADGDDEVSFINASAQPIHLTLLTDLQMLPEIQCNLHVQAQNKYRPSGYEFIYALRDAKIYIYIFIVSLNIII